MNDTVKIAWYGKHFGEEPPLVGNENQGAGGIFFSGCNLKCVFCQNWQISQENLGRDYTIEQLVDIMLNLQDEGATNIDLVTPVIWWKQLKQVLEIVKKNGLTIPVVWNSNGFETVEIIKKFNGLIDIYLPDFKYGDNDIGFKYSKIKRYTDVAVKALREMLKQVGHLKIENDLAMKGVIVRHMVLPNNVDNSFQALEKLAEIDEGLYISLLNQFYPLYHAHEYQEINRVVNSQEFKKVSNYLSKLGFTRGWVQGKESSKVWIPDFRKKKPFDSI